jgi:hypothetical protein
MVKFLLIIASPILSHVYTGIWGEVRNMMGSVGCEIKDEMGCDMKERVRNEGWEWGHGMRDEE